MIEEQNPDEYSDICSHLWHTMTLSQLAKQQEMLLGRIDALASVMGQLASPQHYTRLYQEMQTALQVLNHMMDQKAASKQPTF